jgi:hypothetical protein
LVPEHSADSNAMRIVWVVEHSDMLLASFRLRCWYFHQELQQRGISSTIYQRGRFPSADLVIFQKAYSSRHVRLARELKAIGIRLVYNLSDLVPAGTVNFAGTAQLLGLSDRVIVNGRSLGEFFVDRHNPNWSVVEDPYDCTLAPKGHENGRNEPRVFWHGSHKNYRLFVAPLCPRLRFPVGHLTDQTNPKWTLALFPDYARPFEIGFAPLPLHNPYVVGKSSNKIVGYMALGLAVIASDHMSYREVIEHGNTGFLGVTASDFNAAYERLRDPLFRQQMAEAGYHSVLDRFSVSTLTDKLLAVLGSDEECAA